MNDEIYRLTRLLGGEGIYFMIRLSAGEGVYYLSKELPIYEWVSVAKCSFALSAAVLLTNWDRNPGAYFGIAGSLTIPWASQVQIVPTGGFQKAHVPDGYAGWCDFKTQIEFHCNGTFFTQFSMETEARAQWLRGPFIMNLGDDKKIAWGAGDDPLADNSDDAVTFSIYARI